MSIKRMSLLKSLKWTTSSRRVKHYQVHKVNELIVHKVDEFIKVLKVDDFILEG